MIKIDEDCDEFPKNRNYDQLFIAIFKMWRISCIY